MEGAVVATGRPTSPRCVGHAREKYTMSRKKRGRKTVVFAQGMRTQARGATRVDATQRRSAQGMTVQCLVDRTFKEVGRKVGGRHTSNGREIRMM